MSLDLTELGQNAVEMFESLDEQYGEFSGVQVGVVAVVVEITWDDGDDKITSVSYRCSDPRRWIQHGIFSAAVRAVEVASKNFDEFDDD